MRNATIAVKWRDRLTGWWGWLKKASRMVAWPISSIILGTLLSFPLQDAYGGVICLLPSSYSCESGASIAWNILLFLLLILALGFAILKTSQVVANSIELLVKNPREFSEPVHALIVPLSKIEEDAESRGTGNHKYFGATERKKIIEHFSINNTNSITFSEVTKADYAITQDNPNKLEKFIYFPWQQQFKVIGKILLDDNRNALNSIHVLASSESAAQRRDFKKMLEALLKNQGSQITVECKYAGVDYNDPTAVKNAMSSIIDELKSHESQGQETAKYIAIDITGGQRTFGAMAAILSTQKNVCFTYVADEGENKYSVKFYNIDRSRLSIS